MAKMAMDMSINSLNTVLFTATNKPIVAISAPLFSPQYDTNRFKIFMSNTPRHADALVVMGVYTDGMEAVLKEAYDAMPSPKIVIGIGACALSGGIIGSRAMEKYDIEVAGCPPTPASIINAIIKARGKK